jgi:hypothetical protein
MARRRRDSKDQEPPERDEEKGREEGDEKPPTRRRPKLGNPDANPVRIHREYVEQRLEGGGPATPEAYDEALRQWQKIPGAVSRPAAEVPRAPERPKDPQAGDESTANDDDRDTGSSS